MHGSGWAWQLAAFAAIGVCGAQQRVPSDKAISALEAEASGVPTFGTTVVLPSGLRGDVYRINPDTYTLPDFSRLEPMGAIWTSSLNIPPRHFRSGFPGVTNRFEWFAINYTGRFWIEKPGMYYFALKSDDGSRLWIDDEEIIDNDCQHPPNVVEGDIILSGGPHTIRVSYFQGPRDCIALVLAVKRRGEDWRIFSTDEFKPPPNTEDWKFGDPSELKAPPDPDAQRKKLGGSSRKPPKEIPSVDSGRAKSTIGCIAEPIPRCHP